MTLAAELADGRLLVSVRSAGEAKLAVSGGASIIDVKEPSRGSLGRANSAVWGQVRTAVPISVPVSVALGELAEWDAGCDRVWNGIAFAKIGLARAGGNWVELWRRLDDELRHDASAGFSWVAVCYVDWRAADAPSPDHVIDVAAAFPGCVGVLFDTWDKAGTERLDLGWFATVERVKRSGLFVAVAGSLDAARIEELAELRPDIWAVRGAACRDGRRDGPIDPERVARLMDVVRRA